MLNVQERALTLVLLVIIFYVTWLHFLFNVFHNFFDLKSGREKKRSLFILKLNDLL